MHGRVLDMDTPNLARRDSRYWWGRTLRIGDERIPPALSLRTGNFYQARIMAGFLTAAVETLRMRRVVQVGPPSINVVEHHASASA